MRITVAVLLFSGLLGLTQCSVKKRAYRSGYYISWNSKKHKASTVQTQKAPKVTMPLKADEPASANEAPTQVVASENHVLPAQIAERTKITVLENKDECGDIITFRKGTEVKAKVIEINETQIKYKRCDNLDGPLMIVNKNDVFSIKYTNGLLEHFDRSADYTPTLSNKKAKQQEVHPLAYVTLGLTIGIIFLSIFALVAAIIVGTIARRKILEQPTRYSGLGMVKTCLIICWVLVALAVFFVVMTLSVFGI